MTEFRINGRFVLLSMIGFFLAIFIANGILITLAVKSFPGEQEEKSYLQGIAYNRTLEARAQQAALGWTAALTDLRREGQKATIELTFKTASGTPLSSLALSGVLVRTVDDDHDRAIAFAPMGDGRYVAEVDGMTPGAWRLQATAAGVSGESFVLEKRLTLK